MEVLATWATERSARAVMGKVCTMESSTMKFIGHARHWSTAARGDDHNQECDAKQMRGFMKIDPAPGALDLRALTKLLVLPIKQSSAAIRMQKEVHRSPDLLHRSELSGTY